MDVVQFFQENNEFVENEHLFYEKSYDHIDMNSNINNNRRSNNNNNNNLAVTPKSVQSSSSSSNNSKNKANKNKSPNTSNRKTPTPPTIKTATNSKNTSPKNTSEMQKENNQLKTAESLFNSNSFTDYSSIDCDSLTDSSNKWQQNNTENNKNNNEEKQEQKSRYYSNDDYQYTRKINTNKNANGTEVDNDIKEDLLINNGNDARPRISRQKQPLLAEILSNDNDEDNDYEEIQLKHARPDRPRTRRGRGQSDFATTESRGSRNSDYVQLNECVSTTQQPTETTTITKKHQQNSDEEIKEEIPDELSTNNNKHEAKIVEVINFEDNDNNIENDAELYTPPLPIDDEEPMSEQSNKNSVEYVTVDKIIQPSDRNSRNNNNNNNNNHKHNNNIAISKNLPKITTSQHVNKSEGNYYYNNNHSQYSTNKYNNETNSGRMTTLSNFKDYRLTLARNREKYNVSRSTTKSNDNNIGVSLHARKMNQEELLKSVNRLYYVPKRNFEHPRFKTLHDKFSNVDIDAVSLRLFSSKAAHRKDVQENQKPVKYLNKIEVDKLMERLVAKSNNRVPESCRVIKKSEYKNMGIAQSWAWKGY